MNLNLLFKILLSGVLGLPLAVTAQGPDNAFQEKAAGWLREDGRGFVENKGQLYDQQGRPNTSVKYLLNMPGLNVQLRSTGFSYDTWVKEKNKRRFHRVDIELEGANAGAMLTAAQPFVEATNIINEHGSFSGIRSYRKVTYQNIYPGIDLEFVVQEGTSKPIEYNFIVHPGADASMIRMKYNGQKRIGLKQGNIEMALNHGTLSERIPASWIAGSGKELAVRYQAIDKNVYAFNVPVYNKKETLIIDPTPNLEWATYYGGSAVDIITGIATDSEGNIYIGGVTASSSNIATAGAFDGTYGGGTTGANPNEDAFIAKFTTSGQRVWGTYFGGTGRDSATAITVKGGVIYIGGTSNSAGMATAGAHQASQTAANIPTGLLAKFDATTGQRTWSSYFGGSIKFLPSRIAVDDQDNFYVFGGFITWTQTPTGINVTTAGTFRPTLPTPNIVTNQFQTALVKFNAAGVRQWGTYVALSEIFPGPPITSSLSYIGPMELDANGDPYVSGTTTSTDLAANASEGQTNLGSDVFILKMNKTNGQRTWGRYFGGPSADYIHDMHLDKAGQTIYVAGQTKSETGIATPGAFVEKVPGLQTTGVLVRGGFFASFDLNGAQKMGTYLSSLIIGQSIGVGVNQDSQGNLYVLTQANEPTANLGTNCSYRPNLTGGTGLDVVVTRFTPQGQRVWGTYLGTTSGDVTFSINGGITEARGKSLATDPQGNIIVVYNTTGAGAATAGSFQPNFAGGTNDGVITKLNEGLVPSDVKVTASVLSPMSQTGCALGIPGTITGNAVSLYNPPGYTSPVFYQWQVADASTGPWTNMEGEVYKDLQPLSSQTAKYYRRLVLLNNGYCDIKSVDTSDVAEVLVNSNVAPIASANGPQWFVCGSPNNTVTLNGTATGGSGVYSSYQWYEGSNLTTPVFTGANYTPAVTAITTYTLKVTDNAGCIDVDQLTVSPVIANAGPDVSYCQNSGGVQIGTTGTPGGAVTYAWTLSTGASAAATLSCTNCAQPVASPTATTTYRVTTTVTRKDGSTCSSFDDVVVTFVAAPTGTPGFGGTDKNICKSNTVVLGGVNDAAATYSWSPTSYLSASNIYNPTFNAGSNNVQCPMVYTVTATKGGCTFTDQVSVTVIDASTSLDNQTVSCEGWSSGNTNNCSGATYSWQLVSGPGVAPTGASLRNGGADAYLVNNGTTNAVYRRVTTVNGVNCTSADITISPCSGTTPQDACPAISIAMTSPQGCPKVFGQQELQLRVNGINAADYNFSWSPANIMDNPTAPAVTITSTAAATVSVTVTNKYSGRVCTAPGLPINNPAWSLPVLNIADKATCPSTPVTIGEPSTAGATYAWSPAAGLSSTTIGNPVATVGVSSSFHVVKTDASGCSISGNVAITVRSIDFDAGVDRAICNGATATLGTTPGGSYTYSWTPANAAWTNGTGPTDANPQVLFAGSSQIFNVTITDPLTGCQKTDAVTLRGSVLAGEYAGAGNSPAACPGETVQLGAAAIPNATYSWSPATGLSCTTCSNPVATAGAADQTYTVQVSYPGCTIPVSDQVTVSVNSLPAVVLTDKTICPTTPTNIGIGGTGNTASLAGVSKYEWSPASGLSCTNCASPNANPVAITTYKVIITFTSGCTLEREVTITPAVMATARPDATICANGSVVLGSPAVPNVSYSWSVVSGTAGSITPVNVAQPTANPSVTSVYRLTATGTGPNAGCTVTDDVQVTVKALPVFNITGNTSVCEGGSVTLGVNPVTPNVKYQWSPIAGVAYSDSSSTTIKPVATTTYRVTQTDINSGCSNYKEVVVAVHPNNVSATGGSISVCPASSALMPLTVSPASGNTISWSPATYLNNPYVQNPTITPQSGGTYIATVINSSTSCSDTALVTVVMPANCLGSDYGDAPAVYEMGSPASHGISSALKIGAATDAEGSPVSALLNALATGDDNNTPINDEEGISFLPSLNTGSGSLGVVVNNVLNNTGSTAYLVAWIDFNRDGDFDDAGERSAITTLSSGTASTNPVLQFNGFNNGCKVSGGLSYLRVRLTTDNTGNWSTDPQSNGVRTNGEVEDYSIVIKGADFGDAPALYTAARALVNPDLDNDGAPDEAGSVWLGNIVDYAGCAFIPSIMANADDNDGTADEDGLNMNGDIAPGTTKVWNLTVNSQGAMNDVQWGIWIDWNADGVFDGFYNGSVNTASPTLVPVSVTAAGNKSPNYIVRVGVKTGAAFASADFNYPITNGEWEDYIGPNSTLDVTLTSFTATRSNNSSLLRWQTASEENSDYFAVERSGNGFEWKEIGRVNAAGNSSTNLTYTYTDLQPLEGKNFYRLRIVDKDGSYEHSETRLVNFGVSGNSVSIVPNPAHVQATLEFAHAPRGRVIVKIWDNLGHLIQTYNLNVVGQKHKLNLPATAQGIYHVTVEGEDVHQHVKLVIQ